jgi:hypothetical protein
MSEIHTERDDQSELIAALRESEDKFSGILDIAAHV